MKHFFVLMFLAVFTQNVCAQGSGDAAQFNGSSFIDLDSSYRVMSNPMTFTCWVKRSNSLYARIFLSNYYSTGYSGVWVQVTGPGQIAISYGDGTGFASSDRRSIISSGNHAFLNTWVHCAIVMTSLTSGQIYVNGVLVSSFADGSGGPWFQSQTGDGAFGKTSGGNGIEYFTGQIDEVTIWNKALTAAEVRNLVCRKTNPNKNLLLGYYNFDTSVGNQIFDGSPNNYNGVFVGAKLMPVSGASIGDTSYYSYSNSGVSSFSQTLTTGKQIEVSNISQNTLGVQVYDVLSAPNSTFGLPANASLQNYFGVFLAKTDNSIKTFRLKINNYHSGMSVFQRSGNDDNIWTSISPVSVVGNVAEFPQHANYKEYYIHEPQLCRVDLSVDIDTCFPVSIWLKDKFFHPSKNYTWNTGSMADSLLITLPGTYYVQTDSLGCIKYDTIVVTEINTQVDLGADIQACSPLSVWIKDAHFSPTKTYTWNTGSTVDSLQVTAPGTYYVRVDSAGCTAYDTVLVIEKNVRVNLGSDFTICAQDERWIKDFYYHPTKSYTWSTGATADSIFVTSSQTVSVTADSAGCTGTDNVVVTVKSYSPPIFVDEIKKCVETPLYVEFPEGDYTFLWPNGSTLNSYTFRLETQVSFYTISPCGDSTVHEIDVLTEVCDEPCYLFVPNSFTPNGDFKNDVFEIGVNCDITNFDIKIFNRWGNIVFHSKNPYFKWDGTFEGELNDGVYTYYIEYSGFDEEIKSKQGLLQILL